MNWPDSTSGPTAGICICICTFRRPEGLRRVLASMATLALPTGVRVELLVVDNDAAGSAQAVFDAVAPTLCLPSRLVVEATPGVGHARARCIAEASGDWIAFIDDDEWAEPQWLLELVRTQQSREADGVFGPVLAAFEHEAPGWLLASRFFERPRHPTGMALDWPDCASGNVLFRRSLFDAVGGFDPAFAISGGEDSDFFWRCLSQGARFVWCDEAVAHEGIPAARMTRDDVLRRAYLGGQNYVRLHARRQGWRAYVRFAARGAMTVLCFAPLAWAARLRGRPDALRLEGKLQGGLGKLGAAWTPASQVYGAQALTESGPPTRAGR